MNTTTLTLREAATRLGLPYITVRRWVAAGYFPGAYKRFGANSRGWRIPEAAIVAVERWGEGGEKPI